MDMFDLLNGLTVKVEGMGKPDGSPEFPAQTCRDIQMCFPEAETGKQFTWWLGYFSVSCPYFIDHSYRDYIESITLKKSEFKI